MDLTDDGRGFEHTPAFTRVGTSGSLVTGALEARYQAMLEAVLEDGVITSEERASLERTAEDLGLDRRRLERLEQAMIAAFEAHRRVHVVERFEQPVPSADGNVAGAPASEDRAALVARIHRLESRVRDLEEELRRAQAAVNVEVDLTDLEESAGAAQEDPELAQRRLRRDPTLPEPYHELYRLYTARGDLDRQWCVAQALVALGDANPDQNGVFERHRTGALIAPRGGVTPEAWQAYLLHPEAEPLTGQIFGVIAPALLLGRVSALRREGKLHQPGPETRQDPQKATVTAVRAVPWAAAILGLSAPILHVEPDRDGGYEHVPAVPPLTVIGRRVLSGRSQLELAFHVGRHLAFYRQEHFVRTLWSAVPDLEELFLAALAVGNVKLPIAEDLRRRVMPIAAALEPLLGVEQVDALRALYLRFVEEGGRTNLLRWCSAVDRTACRAGLLLAGDLGTALSVLEAEEGRAGPLAKDLLIFTVSDRYAMLRRELGMAL